MLRNPAYHGQAAFGKTQTTGQLAKPTRPVRARGERHGRRETRRDVAPEQWTNIPVPALITDETFQLAQARLQENKHYAKRNSREPALLKGILVCRDCGYARWRTSARTTKRVIYYYRCIGSDNYRHAGGRVCSNRPIRADELDALVWGEVEQLLSNPALIRAEIERRLSALRTESPAAHRRDGLERELARVKAGNGRLIEAYQEQLITLDELRARMPALRKREATLAAQLDALDAELHDAETYLQLAENLEGFLARLAENAQNLTTEERQRVIRLVVREVLIGNDTITIRHSIPTPKGGDSPDCLLRGSSRGGASRGQPRPDWHPTRHQDMDSPRFKATAGAPPNRLQDNQRRQVAPAPPRRPPQLGSQAQKCQSRVEAVAKIILGPAGSAPSWESGRSSSHSITIIATGVDVGEGTAGAEGAPQSG